MERRHPPVVAAAGRLVRAGHRRADHHGVGATGDRLGDVAAGAHAAVGDHVAVAAGLVQVLAPRGRRVGDRGGLRHADPEHAARRARVARSDPDQHADRAGPHQVQGGRVRRAPADDHGDVERRDELLQVERLELRLETCSPETTVPWITRMSSPASSTSVGVLLDPLGRERGARDDPARLDLLDPLADQLLLDRLRVELLHPAGGLLVGEPGDLVVDRAPGPRTGSTGPRGSGRRARRAGRSRSRWSARRRRPSRSPSSGAGTCTRRSPS